MGSAATEITNSNNYTLWYSRRGHAEAELSSELHSAEVSGIVRVQTDGANRTISPGSFVKIEYAWFLPQNIPDYSLL